MFSDPHISLMIMILLCFMGMLVMFLFIIKSLSSLTAALREGQTRQQSALADMEQQIMDMNFILRQISKGTTPAAGESAASLDLPADLDELFKQDDPLKVAGPSTAEEAAPQKEKDYFYPSAAGLEQPDEDLLNISLGLDRENESSNSTDAGHGRLDIKLEK